MNLGRSKTRTTLTFPQGSGGSCATWSGRTGSRRRRRLRDGRWCLVYWQARRDPWEAGLYLKPAAGQGMRAQLRVVGIGDRLNNGQAKAKAIMAADTICA
jgi:hypothetical protein